jgi:hypothetical protein
VHPLDRLLPRRPVDRAVDQRRERQPDGRSVMRHRSPILRLPERCGLCVGPRSPLHAHSAGRAAGQSVRPAHRLRYRSAVRPRSTSPPRGLPTSGNQRRNYRVIRQRSALEGRQTRTRLPHPEFFHVTIPAPSPRCTERRERVRGTECGPVPPNPQWNRRRWRHRVGAVAIPCSDQARRRRHAPHRTSRAHVTSS